MAARFAYVNLVRLAASILVPSDELASMPRGNLLTQDPSVRWRSKTGWMIVAGENDRIDFNRGGVKFATIAAGYYSTGALLGAAIVTAMTAADGATTWTCTYSSSKFTIGGSAAFTLLFLTGVWFERSVQIDLGYTATDKGAAVSQVAENVSYQSRRSLNVDLGSAWLALGQTFAFSAVRGHNVSTAGTFTFQAAINTLVGTGLNTTTAYVLSQVLTGTDPRSGLFAALNKQYLRLIINDVQNPTGYVELGAWFVGTYAQATIAPAVQYSKDNEHLSEIRYADGGAHHQVLRTRRRVYKLVFQLEQRASLAVADRALFDAIDALGIGTNLFAIVDVPSDTLTIYGFNRVGLHEVYVQGTLWAIVMEFAEALG